MADATAIRWLILRVDYDDGFVAYLNGEEIARRGLTNSPVGWDDEPAFHPGGLSEEIDVSAATGLLRDGDNVLAIQVHNATNNTPAAPAPQSVRLTPELLANFPRGPFVQNVTTNSAQVVWKTPVLADSKVEYGLDEALGFETTSPAFTTNHVIALTGLSPGTRYWYRVQSSSTNSTATSPVVSFRTFQTSGPVRFLVVGDSGGQVALQPSGIVPQYRIAEVMADQSADLILHAGDLLYPEFTAGRVDTHFFSVNRRWMRSVPLFPTMGNHDFDLASHGQAYFDAISLPTNSATGTAHYYSFDHGDVHFVSLFTPSIKWGAIPPFFSGLPEHALTNGSVQYSWLTNDLATSSKPWKVILMHLPVNDSGNHRFDDDNLNGTFDRQEIHEVIMPVAQQYGVQLMFAGHDHGYERFTPTNGVYSVISGGGGGPLPSYFYPRVPGSDQRDAGSSQFHPAWHFLSVSVDGDTLRLEAIGTNGMAFDAMTIQRAPPEHPALTEAAWNTPSIEAVPADDGHGNISGQIFDFAGTPLLTAGGEFSNLGRVFVNNDATNLYVGLEQVMLYEDNNVVLFIQSPPLSGVSDLAGLGDGVLGGAEGVEGLDFLDNLSFTNFTPGVAVLLGDEYADENDRLFTRPYLGLTNVGQGVFNLDAGLSTVASARLQQFNRSPQELEPPIQLQYPERNANFMEVAIPLADLGGLQPGETIKIAAVVAGPSFEEQTQNRQLDTSYLGVSFVTAGSSNALLEGLAVRLALDPPGDEDGDGLPNEWEQTYGLDPRIAEGEDGALGDPDGDQMTNLSELVAGTNPRDATSALRLQIQDFSLSHALLSWEAIIGRSYHLQVATSPWQFTNHPSSYFPRTAVSNVEIFLDEFTNSPLPPARYYQMQVIP